MWVPCKVPELHPRCQPTKPLGAQVEIVAADWVDEAFFGGRGPFVGAEHQADAGPVDIAIAEPDAGLIFFSAQRDGEIGRDGRLAHAALAAGDRDDVFHALDLGLRERAALGLKRLADGRADVEVNSGLADAGNRFESGGGRLLDLFGDLRIGGRDRDPHRDARAVDLHVLDHAEGNDVPRIAGIFNAAKLREDGIGVQ